MWSYTDQDDPHAGGVLYLTGASATAKSWSWSRRINSPNVTSEDSGKIIKVSDTGTLVAADPEKPFVLTWTIGTDDDENEVPVVSNNVTFQALKDYLSADTNRVFNVKVMQLDGDFNNHTQRSFRPNKQLCQIITKRLLQRTTT